jgi:hypothetical protein
VEVVDRAEAVEGLRPAEVVGVLALDTSDADLVGRVARAGGTVRIPATFSIMLRSSCSVDAEANVDVDTTDIPLFRVKFSIASMFASTWSISAGERICCGV